MIQVHIIEKAESGYGFSSSKSSFDSDNIDYLKEIYDQSGARTEVHLKSGKALRVRETKSEIEQQRVSIARGNDDGRPVHIQESH